MQAVSGAKNYINTTYKRCHQYGHKQKTEQLTERLIHIPTYTEETRQNTYIKTADTLQCKIYIPIQLLIIRLY